MAHDQTQIARCFFECGTPPCPITQAARVLQPDDQGVAAGIQQLSATDLHPQEHHPNFIQLVRFIKDRHVDAW